VWLNERHLLRLPGVISADINYATRRARVRWDSTRLNLSDILRAIQEIGYVAHPFDASKQDEIFRKERNTAIKRLAIAGLGMMQVMMYAIPTYTADPSEMTPDIVALMRWASLILTIPVIFYSSWPFFQGAWKDFSRRTPGMDVPVAIGIGSAFAASVWATVMQQGEVYYDSVNMFIFLLLGGRFLELNARRRSAQAAEELVKLIPAVATRLPGWPSRNEETVPAAQLAPGDHVLIKPGETVPADGVLVEGNSSVVEAMLTGEPEPRGKQPGTQLIGGTLNQQNPIVMRVEKTGEETRLSAIVRLLDRAQSEKPRIGRMADRAASWFVGLLLLFTVIIAAVWYAIDPDKVLWITVSILVITCPCALGLATPAALTTATGRLTKLGLLTTRGHALETLAQVTDIVFDKTGTLTLGKLSLLGVEPAGSHSREEVLQLAAALEAASEHPIALAIRQATGGAVQSAEAPLNHPGEGVEGSISGHRYRLGKPAFAGAVLPETSLHPTATRLALAGPDWPGGLAVSRRRSAHRCRSRHRHVEIARRARAPAVRRQPGGRQYGRGNLWHRSRPRRGPARRQAGLCQIAAGRRPHRRHGRRRHQRRACAGAGPGLHRHGRRHRRGPGRGRHGDAGRAPGRAGRRRRHRAQDPPHHLRKPGLGARLQPHRHPARRAGPRHALDRRHRHVGQLAAGGAERPAPGPISTSPPTTATPPLAPRPSPN